MGFLPRAFIRPAKYARGLAALAWLAFAVLPAQGQDLAWGRRSCPPVQCPAPEEKPKEGALVIPPTPPIEAPFSEPSLSPERAAAFGGETVALATPNMLGDSLSSTALRCVQFQRTNFVPQTVTVTVQPPFCQGLTTAGNFIFPMTNGQCIPPTNVQFIGPITPVATVNQSTTVNVPVTTTQQICYQIPAACHAFKIADDQNARPQDRVFFDYSYYNNVGANFRLGTDVSNMNVNRGVVGFEKTFFDGFASIQLREPVNSLHIGGSNTPEANGNFTDVGDLTLILKGVLWEDMNNGDVISAGLAVTLPTGPDSLGGVTFSNGCVHSTLIQPYVGYAFIWNNLFLQGFTSVDIPTTDQDSTLMFNDVGLGYFLLRDRNNGRFLTAVAPTVEGHLMTPLSHEGSPTEMMFTPNQLDITEGVTFEFRSRATFAVGISEPVTGSKTYDFEAMAQLNLRF
ncbi:MAG TPA: hypothetical protein VGX70_10475 [Gemmataceae bacterium]|nr:hypothetical protein [Gemmataceae bacterium]